MLIQTQSSNSPLENKGRILVMDDEILIRQMLGKMLTYLGYTSVLTKNGEEAVEIYRQEFEKGQSFHALIFDWNVISGMNGFQALEQILKIDPQAKAFLSSGYSQIEAEAKWRAGGFMGVIDKPFDLKKLSQSLMQVHNQNIFP